MKKVKKMAFGGPSQPGMKPPVAKPKWETVSKAANTPPSAPAKPAKGMSSPISAVTKSIGGQQALFDKNMAQAAALPPEQRAKFAEQFQRAAASGDPSTVRPQAPVQTPDPTLKGAPLMPVFGPSGDYTSGAPKVVPAGSKPYVPPPEFAKQFPTQRAASAAPISKLGMKKGGAVKSYAKGGKVSSASSRGDGIAQRGKTKGRMV